MAAPGKKQTMKGGASSTVYTLVAFIVALVFVVMVILVSIVSRAGTFDAADLTRKPVAISKTSFPDDVLRAYVKNVFDVDGNGYLDAEEVDDVTSIGTYDTSTLEVEDDGLSNTDVTSLVGLGMFPNLQMLVLENDDIATLDLSAMPSVRYVYLRGDERFTITYGSANYGTQLVVDEGTVDDGALAGIDVRSVAVDAASASMSAATSGRG